MENKKLIPLSDFVLEQKKRQFYGQIESSEILQRIFNYTEFLKQPLKLEYFVPCDEECNILSYPSDYDYYVSDNEQDFQGDTEECIRYVRAEKKILFEGFSSNGISIQSFNSNGLLKRQIPIRSFKEYKTIENLIEFHEDLTLTPSALKEIGIKE